MSKLECPTWVYGVSGCTEAPVYLLVNVRKECKRASDYTEAPFYSYLYLHKIVDVLSGGQLCRSSEEWLRRLSPYHVVVIVLTSQKPVNEYLIYLSGSTFIEPRH